MNLQHHFLIAMPSLQDPQFMRSVIYICEHNEEGAMGLVINKPIEQFTVETVLKKLRIRPSPRNPAIRLDKPVLAGGPLAEDRGFILHTPQEGFNFSIPLSPDTMITTSKDVLKTLGTPEQPKNLLVTLGYAGWQQGQLEQELLDNTWLTIEADTNILFHMPMAERWQAAANKLGINIFNIAPQAGHA
jgi:putative transcriptional regulator